MNKAALLINFYGQNKIDTSFVLSYFRRISQVDKDVFSTVLADLIIQSKCSLNDIDQAILESGVKRTANSAVVLRKGIYYHNLIKLFQIKEVETSLVLLIHLFRIGYQRRRAENESKEKWWFNDLPIELLARSLDE